MREFAGRSRSNLKIPFVSLAGRDNGGGSSGAAFFLNQQPLTTWRSQRAAVVAGTARARFIMAGDSSNASYLCDNIANFQAIHAQEARIARLFTAAGIPATYSSGFGGHGAVQLSSWDFRFSQGAWPYEAPGTYGLTQGGEFFLIPTVTTATATFTPQDDTTTPIATDSCDLYYAQDPSQGAISGQVNLLTVVPINQNNATSKVLKQTLTGTLGNNVYKAIYVSGSANWVGFHCYNSAVKAIDCWNMACIGSFATQWSQTTFSWNPPNAWAAYAPSMVFFGVGANDFIGGSTLATIQPMVDAAVLAAQSAGHTIVITGYPPIDTAVLTATQQEALRDMQLAVAVNRGCTFYDMVNRMGGPNAYAANNAAGLMANNEHRNFAGQTGFVNDTYAYLAA